MKRPAELMDWDRQPDARPMGRTEYPPSPRPLKDESAAPIAFACFFLMGGIFGFIGIATVVRWIAEAVR